MLHVLDRRNGLSRLLFCKTNISQALREKYILLFKEYPFICDFRITIHFLEHLIATAPRMFFYVHKRVELHNSNVKLGF